MTIRFNSKEALIEALEGQREVCRAVDKRDADKREAARAEKVAAFHESAKRYAKMSKRAIREEADENGLSLSSVYSVDRWDRKNACRNTFEAKLDRSLRAISVGTQERYTISPSGIWGDEYRLLTLSLDDPCS